MLHCERVVGSYDRSVFSTSWFNFLPNLPVLLTLLENNMVLSVGRWYFRTKRSFPSASAVEGMESVPSVCVCLSVCLSVSALTAEPFDVEAQNLVEALTMPHEVTMSCHVTPWRHNVTPWRCDVTPWHLSAKTLTKRAREGASTLRHFHFICWQSFPWGLVTHVQTSFLLSNKGPFINYHLGRVGKLAGWICLKKVTLPP